MSEATKAPDKMTARQALAAYGFERNAEGMFIKKSGEITQVWRPVEGGGWIRLDPPIPTIAMVGGEDPSGGKPWGKALADTSWVQVPWKQGDAFAGVGGLHPAVPEHEPCFVWVWPDEAVAEIYAYGHTSDYGKLYRRNEKGALVEDTGRKERGEEE